MAVSAGHDAGGRLESLIETIRSRMKPAEIWLFGSRARGDAGADSDWDLVVSVSDDSPSEVFDPLTAWRLQRDLGVPATILVVRKSDLDSAWGVPNTIGYDLARHGRRLDVP